MNRQKTSTAWLIFFLLLFGIIGYCREVFFESMNVIMYMRYYDNSPALRVPEVMLYFSRFSYEQLYYGKYLFTILWTLLFFLANYFALKKLTINRNYPKILIWSYVMLTGASALFMLYAYFVSHRLDRDEYTLSRWLMGIAQSPIICLILLASEKLYNQRANHDTKGIQDF